MYAVVIDNKFTGAVYNEITGNVLEWCDEMSATLIKVDAPPVNVGTEDNPDYGSPTPEQLNQQRISEIKSELSRLDLDSVRPLRAINAGTDTAGDRDKLAGLDSKAEKLRQELEALGYSNLI